MYLSIVPYLYREVLDANFLEIIVSEYNSESISICIDDTDTFRTDFDLHSVTGEQQNFSKLHALNNKFKAIP